MKVSVMLEVRVQPKLESTDTATFGTGNCRSGSRLLCLWAWQFYSRSCRRVFQRCECPCAWPDTRSCGLCFLCQMPAWRTKSSLVVTSCPLGPRDQTIVAVFSWWVSDSMSDVLKCQSISVLGTGPFQDMSMIFHRQRRWNWSSTFVQLGTTEVTVKWGYTVSNCTFVNCHKWTNDGGTRTHWAECIECTSSTKWNLWGLWYCDLYLFTWCHVNESWVVCKWTLTDESHHKVAVFFSHLHSSCNRTKNSGHCRCLMQLTFHQQNKHIFHQ